MIPIFLTTILSCNQLLGIINRVFRNTSISYQQRYEIITELQKYIPSCPVIIQKYDSK
jgi:hypothetical protein